MTSWWLVLCLLGAPVVAEAETLVFSDQVDALVTQWTCDCGGWTHGTFSARIRWPGGIGVSPYGESYGWSEIRLASTRARGATFGEIVALSAYDVDEPGEYNGYLDVWHPWPLAHATRQVGVYTQKDLALHFHTYTVKWRPGVVAWYLDGVLKARTTWVPGDGQPWNVLDQEALGPAIRGDAYHPALVQWVKVWQ